MGQDLPFRFGEAIRSAGEMHQDLYTWMNDAITHHAYRCEQIRLQEQYQLDQQEATQYNRPTVDPQSPRYRPTREKPAITRTATGAPGRSPQPKPLIRFRALGPLRQTPGKSAPRHLAHGLQIPEISNQTRIVKSSKSALMR